MGGHGPSPPWIRYCERNYPRFHGFFVKHWRNIRLPRLYLLTVSTSVREILNPPLGSGQFFLRLEDVHYAPPKSAVPYFLSRNKHSPGDFVKGPRSVAYSESLADLGGSPPWPKYFQFHAGFFFFFENLAKSYVGAPPTRNSGSAAENFPRGGGQVNPFASSIFPEYWPHTRGKELIHRGAP